MPTSDKRVYQKQNSSPPRGAQYRQGACYFGAGADPLGASLMRDGEFELSK
jgi:hypothetical protein